MKNRAYLIIIFIGLFTEFIHAQEDANALYTKAGLEYRKGDFDNAIKYYKQSLELRLEHPFIESGNMETLQQKTTNLEDIVIDKVAKTYRNIGICQFYSFHFPKSLKHLNFSVDIYGLTDASEYKLKDLGNVYPNLAVVYDEFGEYERAIEAANEAFNLHSKREKDNVGSLLHALNLLADLHRRKENYVEGIKFCVKGDSLYHSSTKKDREKYQSNIARIYHTWGFILHEQKKYKSALSYYHKALEYEIPTPESTENNIAWLLIQLNRLDEAEQMLHSAIDKKREKYETPYHYRYSATLENFAEVEMAKNNHEAALNYFQSAIINLTDNFRNQDIHTNPTVTDNHYIYNKPDLLRVLDLKAQAALKSNNTDLAYNTYQTLDNWINELYKDLSTKQSKLTWIARAHDIYTHAIEVALKKGDKEQAFAYAEKARAVLLWQSHSRQAALNLLSNEDREKQENISVQIRQADQQYRDAAEKEKEDLRRKITTLETQSKQLEQQLEEKYPEYAKRKYQPKTITIADVQNKIVNDSTTLIEYHWSEDSLYIFTLTQKDIFVNTVGIDTVFYQHIDRFNTSLKNSSSKLTDLSTSGYAIYQKILTPALRHLNDDIKKLTLLPDGKLNYVVFEALPLQKDSQVFNIPYLIDNYTVNYLYSCNAYGEATTKKQAQSLLGIAPTYEKTKGLDDLEHNQAEVSAINKMYSGKVLLGSDATREALTQDTSDIIHIASHATQGEGEGKIYLYGDDVLTQKDIQTLSWKNVQQVILSACETGTGELSKGEGVLSLGWSFVYRGVPSVVMSQWKVDDGYTKELMLDYHKKLQEKIPADEALRQAKLNFRKNGNDAQKHPYYWAGFIHTGNPPTGQSKASGAKIWYILLGSLFVAGAIFLYRSNGKKSSN